MEAREQAKRDALANAKFPVDGLSFTENAILYKGLPLDQPGQAERIRISCAIAAALNSKLRVILIRDGNDLDDDGLAAVYEFAEINDMQIWLEVVGTSADGVGVVLEAGEVVADNQ